MYNSTSTENLPTANAYEQCVIFRNKSYITVQVECDNLSTFTYGFNEQWVSWSNSTLMPIDNYRTTRTKPLTGTDSATIGKAA